jgi:phosphatidylglycerol:prolipoprotein diacylglycerol transferase
VPNFTWSVDPIALEIPKGPLLLVVGAIAALMLITGLVKRENDLSIFGLFMGAVLLIASSYLPDPIGLRYYSLLFVGVFLGGYALLNWQIRRAGGPVEAAGDFIVYGVAGVLIGARLGHVIFYDYEKAIEDPLWVLQIWTGGLASHGAVLGLIFAMWLFARRRGVPFLEGADRFAFSAALGATLVRLGNFFNSEIVGREVPDQSWGVRFPLYDVTALEPPLRYPTQLFEFTLGLFVLLCLWLVDRWAGKEKRPRGLLISVFFLVYFSGRFGIEFFKELQVLSYEKSSPITMGQTLSLPGIALGLFGVFWSLKRQEPAGWPGAEVPDEDETSDEEDDDDGHDPDVDEELSGKGQSEPDEDDGKDRVSRP